MNKPSLLLLLLVAHAYCKTLVLGYHAFSPNPVVNTSINPEYFRHHIRELKSEGFKIIDLQTALQNFISGDTSRLPEALITIDDGWGSVLKYALPILKEEDAKATVFIYPRAISHYDGFLTWEDIQTLISSGLIDIGSHGVSHTPLKREFIFRKLYYSWFVEGELMASKEIIEFHTGKSIYAIAYPMGYYSDFVIEVANKVGYKLGFTTENPLNTKWKGRLAIPRFFLSKNDRSISWLLKRFKEKYNLEPEAEGQPVVNHLSSPYFVLVKAPLNQLEIERLNKMKPGGVVLTFDNPDISSQDDSLSTIEKITLTIPFDCELYLNLNFDLPYKSWAKENMLERAKQWKMFGVDGVVLGCKTENDLVSRMRGIGLKVFVEIYDAFDFRLNANAEFDGLIIPDDSADEILPLVEKPCIIMAKRERFSEDIPPWAFYVLFPLDTVK